MLGPDGKHMWYIWQLNGSGLEFRFKSVRKTIKFINSKFLQNTSRRACKISTTSTCARVARSGIGRTSLLICMTIKTLTSVTSFQWDCVPSVVSEDTTSQNAAVHAHEAWLFVQKYFTITEKHPRDKQRNHLELVVDCTNPSYLC